MDIYPNSTNSSEFIDWKPYDRAAAILCFTLFAVIASMNGLVIYTLTFKERKKSRLYFFIFHLAIADLLVGTICVLGDGIISAMDGAWYAGDVFCRIWRYLKVVVFMVSNNLLIGLSIDRFLAVKSPLNFVRLGNVLGRSLVIAAWSVSVLLCIFILPYSHGQNGTPDEGGHCDIVIPPRYQQVENSYVTAQQIYRGYLFVSDHIAAAGAHNHGVLYFTHQYYHDILSEPPGAHIGLRLSHPLMRDECRKGWMPRPGIEQRCICGNMFLISMSATTFLVPSIIITICYTGICVLVWRKWRKGLQLSEMNKDTSQDRLQHHKNKNSGLLPRAKIKSIKMTLVVCLAFVTCWTPYFVFTMLDVFEAYDMDPRLNMVVQMLYPLNSACNPIVFILFNTKLFTTRKRYANNTSTTVDGVHTTVTTD